MRDLETTYEQARGRMVDLVTEAGAGGANTIVPACPEWCVRDVVAHVSAVCADIIRGSVAGPPDDLDGWTAGHVTDRRERSVAEIIDEWAEFGPLVAARLDNFPGRYGPHVVMDVNTHEQDIRGAVGKPGARDHEGIRVSVELLVEAFLQPAMSAYGLPPLELDVGGQPFVIGTDEPATGDQSAWRVALLDSPPPFTRKPPVSSVAVSPFELFRAATGRRSTDQIKQWDWSLDPEPYFGVFGYGPFKLRDTDLVE